MIHVTDVWRQAHPGSSLGFMIVDQLRNDLPCTLLEETKENLEKQLKSAFESKEDLHGHFPLPLYIQYYKQYKKTYHVLQQLESIIFKGKTIPSVTPAVTAMFMAELKSGLLTAGHDYHALQFPLTLDAAAGEETYLLINGKQQEVKPLDMFLSDAAGVTSSIIHGPDFRTRILPETQKAAFVIYAPAGIPKDGILTHLSDIYKYICLASPDTKMCHQAVYT